MSFEVVCEIAPPDVPDLAAVREQVYALSPAVRTFLVPDNHLGRATISSIAAAHEVQLALGENGGTTIACLNARDRNLLGFRRDVLTGAAYGIDRFLLVRGDDPAAGARTGELTVRSMLAEARRSGGVEAGVTTRLGPLPEWKQDADFLFVQISFSATALLRWRETVRFAGPVYAGVIVLASAPMARRLAAAAREIDIPQRWIEAVENDRRAGVGLALDLVQEIRESGAFDGVHLVPGVRFADVATQLREAGEPRSLLVPSPGPGCRPEC